MITLTARINLLSDGAGAIRSASSTISGINISPSIPVGQKKTVTSPFLLGYSKLGGGDTYSSGDGCFRGSVFSGNAGEDATSHPFPRTQPDQPAYVITINGANISAFTIAFDDRNGRHPNTILVDDVPYTDDDPFFTMSVSPANSHTIGIDDWNTPNSPLVISGIYVDLSIDLDYSRITSVSRTIRERGEVGMPSWGIISNGGELEFNDFDGEVLDYIEQGILKSGVEVTVNLNNTIANQSKQVAKYYVDTVNYDVNNKSVSIEIKDRIEKLQDINNIQFQVNPLSYAAMRFSEIYQYLQGKVVEAGVDMVAYNDLDEDTKNALTGYVATPITDSGNSLWQLLNKFAIATQTHLYVRADGVLTCRYNGGN